MRLTVFVITRGRPRLLARCVASVAPQLPADCELQVLVNGSDAETEQWLRDYDHPRVRWRVQTEEHRTVCRNRAFVEAAGEVVYFLDDDVVLPPGGVGRLLARFASDPDLVVVGGPNCTPPDSSWQQKVYGAVMTSAVAAPMVRVRYGAGPKIVTAVTERELVLCNLAVKRRRIPTWLRFPAHYLGSEENIFLFFCKQRKLKLAYDPECRVFHARRANLKGFFHQIFYYGAGRAQQTLAAPRSLHPLFLGPPLLVPCALGVAVTAPGWFLSAWLAYTLLGVAGAVGSGECRKLSGRGVAAVGVLTPFTHLFYGLGFWRGWLGAFCGLNKAEHVRPPVVQARESLTVS